LRSSHIFQLLHHCCLCVLNSHCSHSGLSLYKILDPFLFLYVGYTVCSLLFIRHKLLFKS
jgi:hypothetical protein